MRKTTKQGKRKKRQKAMKLLKSDSLMDKWKGSKFMKQADRVPYGTFTKSNY